MLDASPNRRGLCARCHNQRIMSADEFLPVGHKPVLSRVYSRREQAREKDACPMPSAQHDWKWRCTLPKDFCRLTSQVYLQRLPSEALEVAWETAAGSRWGTNGQPARVFLSHRRKAVAMLAVSQQCWIATCGLKCRRAQPCLQH